MAAPAERLLLLFRVAGAAVEARVAAGGESQEGHGGQRCGHSPPDRAATPVEAGHGAGKLTRGRAHHLALNLASELWAISRRDADLHSPHVENHFLVYHPGCAERCPRSWAVILKRVAPLGCSPTLVHVAP